MAKTGFSWLYKLQALLVKDFQEEFRSRYALSSLLMFSVTSLVLISFSLGAGVWPANLHGALLWIVFFFAAMSGLGRSFIREEEKNTAALLKLSCSPELIFLGKFFFNLLLSWLVSILVLFLYLVLMNPPLASPGLLAAVVLGGGFGLAGAVTILAAIVARAANQSTLLPILAFPILLPLLMAAIEATRQALEGGGGMGAVGFLYSYSFILLAVSLLLFEYVWNA